MTLIYRQSVPPPRGKPRGIPCARTGGTRRSPGPAVAKAMVGRQMPFTAVASHRAPWRRRVVCGLGSACLAALTWAQDSRVVRVAHGELREVNGARILELDGTPEQMGAAYGTLLKPVIQRVVREMIVEGIGFGDDAYANIQRGSGEMEPFQPEHFRRELSAMAAAADVEYRDLLLLQYFGDVRRCIAGAGSSPLCTSFAILPPLTREQTCIVGRNLDYFDHGVGDYASLLVHYRPRDRIPFVTVTWAGIINGWTLLNGAGLAVSNNTAFGAEHHSLRGISTCFLLRLIAESARTVEEGVDLIRASARSCGTSMLVASGNPPDAAIVEFDAQSLAVRRPKHGFVGADNSFRSLYCDATETQWGYSFYSRVGRALALARRHSGEVDVNTTIAGAEGVPIEYMNLHCAQVDTGQRVLRVAMGRIPAYRLPFRSFQLTADGLIPVE